MTEPVAFLIEYLFLYVLLVLVPAIIRSVIDTVVLKIPKSAFDLPPNTVNSVKFHSFYSNVVSTALFYPLFEEIVFRGAPLAFTGLYGFILANAVWILMHPAWQVRYVTHLPLKTQFGFILNTAFYYTCAGTFFSYAWLKGYPLFAILFHMGHNFLVVLAGILSDVELPAPWKREEFFKEDRGLKKKMVERFFKDEKPVPISDEELEAEYEISDRFYRKVAETSKKQTKTTEKKSVEKPAGTKSVARVSDDWIFWYKR